MSVATPEMRRRAMAIWSALDELDWSSKQFARAADFVGYSSPGALKNAYQNRKVPRATKITLLEQLVGISPPEDATIPTPPPVAVGSLYGELGAAIEILKPLVAQFVAEVPETLWPRIIHCLRDELVA